jgi:hypothetical protein
MKNKNKYIHSTFFQATGSHDHVVYLYDFDKPPPLEPIMLRGHFGNVRALAFSNLSYLVCIFL